MVPGRIPDPDAFWPSHIQIAFGIEAHAIGDTVVWIARLFTKDATIADTAILEVVHPDVLLL